MQKINLTAANPTEQRILDHLSKNASAVLAEKINTGKKTLSGALEYAKAEAKTLAKGQPCICVDDATVFGWIIHFFEEDAVIQQNKPAKPSRPAAKTPAPVRAAIVAAHPQSPCAQRQAPSRPAPLFLELFTPEEMGAKP